MFPRRWMQLGDDAPPPRPAENGCEFQSLMRPVRLVRDRCSHCCDWRWGAQTFLRLKSSAINATPPELAYSELAPDSTPGMCWKSCRLGSSERSLSPNSIRNCWVVRY